MIHLQEFPYNVGVVLPQFEYDTPEYEIPAHLLWNPNGH